MQAWSRVSVTLSGGGTRMYGHLGVLAAIEDAGLKIGQVDGVSGGAVVAAAYACLGLEGAIAALSSFDTNRLFRFGWFRGLGLFDNSAIAELARDLGITWERAAKVAVQLRIGVTALEPGVPLVWTPHDHPLGVDLGEAVRISASIPLLWGHTRMAADRMSLPGRPPDAPPYPGTITLVDGGCSEMILGGSPHTPTIASNIAFNGYREHPVNGLVDYLAQMLSVLQYRAMENELAGAALVVKHRTMRAMGWVDRLDAKAIAGIIETARIETKQGLESLA